MAVNAPMLVDQAIERIRETPEYLTILEHITICRENLLVEFRSPEVIASPQALAFLAGKIEQSDSLLMELGGPVYPRDVSQLE